MSFAITIVGLLLATPPPQTDTSSTSEIVLLDQGAPPWRALRLKPVVGHAQRATLTTDSSMKMAGAIDMPTTRAPRLRVGLRLKVTDVDSGGAGYTFVFDHAEVDKTKGASPLLVDAVKAALRDVVGTGGVAVVSATGRPKSRQLNDAKPPQTSGLVDGVDRALNQLSAPFPHKPVGVGARWTSTMVVDIHGVQITQTAIHRIDQMKGDQLVLSATLTYSAAKQSVGMPGLPRGTVLKTLTGHGKGKQTISLAEVLPLSSQVDGVIVMVFNDDGGAGDLSVTTRMSATLANRP